MKMSRSIVRRSLLLALSILFTASSAFPQGSLTPPGAPAPTMKTLDQVEARIIVNAANTPGDAVNTFVITQPGSYYLTGNITGASGKHGILIQANDVTLDLNGFALVGNDGGGNVIGVTVPTAQTNFCVRNGSVRGWNTGGVRADTTVTLAEKLMLANNVGGIGAIGLAVGNGSMIKDCVASGNTTGFHANDRTHVINCISTVNTGVGFDCTGYVTIVDCTSSRNGGTGIVVQAGCTVMRCNASKNTNSSGGFPNGITAGDGCTIADCTAASNGQVQHSGDGFNLGNYVTITNCTASGNIGRGITVGGSSSVLHCTASSNLNGGSGAGIVAGIGCTVADCTASGQNSGDGISVGAGSTVRGCTATYNSRDGITLNGNSMVTGCTASQNGQDGIDTTASNNRIDSNHTISNGNIGINSINATADWTVRNVSYGNHGAANYSPNSGTFFGPLGTPDTAPAHGRISSFKMSQVTYVFGNFLTRCELEGGGKR